MFVTSAEDRAGVLVAIISGGRPKIGQRPTARLVESLRDAGVGDVVWVVQERDALAYEDDGNELVVYSDEWALEYAAAHWMQPDPPEAGAFLGAFVGREWSCLTAEARGYSTVLQLDDNIESLGFVNYGRGGRAVARSLGAGGFTDLLLGTLQATNARTVGAQLTAIPEPQLLCARPGFPYSFFVEQLGEGREPWYGPFEDDIMHSLQYGDRADGATAVVMPTLLYKKESQSKTGMRAAYNHERSRQLQRLQPQSANVSVQLTKANGLGGPRVFHSMSAGAVRNPITLHDPASFYVVRDRMRELVGDWETEEREGNREKARERSAKFLEGVA